MAEKTNPKVVKFLEKKGFYPLANKVIPPLINFFSGQIEDKNGQLHCVDLTFTYSWGNGKNSDVPVKCLVYCNGCPRRLRIKLSGRTRWTELLDDAVQAAILIKKTYERIPAGAEYKNRWLGLIST